MQETRLKPGVVLYPYQNDAIKWMVEREKADPKQHRGIRGGLLCLEMGLGKTLTTLEHSMRSQRKNKETFPTLVVASKTVMYEWKSQGIEKFYKKIQALYFHKDFCDISKLTGQEICSYNIVITTYDQCLSIARTTKAHKHICEYGQAGIHKNKVVAIHTRKKPPFRKLKKGAINLYCIPWARVICDESQRFANPTTYTFKAMMALYGEHKWCLTGTPVRNYDTDLWAQLRFCGYYTITTSKEWKRESFVCQGLRRYLYENNYETAQVKMPPLKEYHHSVKMDPDQKKIYKAMLLQTQNAHEQMVMRYVNYANVLALVTRLRQACIAPYLLVATRNKDGTFVKQNVKSVVSGTDIDDWVHDDLGPAGIDSPKIKKIIDILKKIPKNEKCIIFSMFTSCLQLTKNAIDIDMGDCYAYLDGSKTGPERFEALERFKTDPSTRILLIHYKVGGEGLNLVEANHVICIEPWWSPAVHKQAIARCWRRGQTKPVHVHWVVSAKTIEDPIRDMCANKIKLANYYLHEEEYVPTKVGLSKIELQKLLGDAAGRYFCKQQ